MSRVRVVLALALTAGICVVGTDAATYAANGDSLILGKVNKAKKTTTIKTKRGPALTLRTKPSAPPLKVSSATKVANLNADLLDGVDSAALEPTGLQVSLGATLADGANFVEFQVPAGTYQVTLDGVLDVDAGEGYLCAVWDKAKFLVEDITGVYAASIKSTGDTNGNGMVSGTSVAVVPAGRPIVFGCSISGSVPVGQPVKATFRPLTVSTVPSTKLVLAP